MRNDRGEKLEGSIYKTCARKTRRHEYLREDMGLGSVNRVIKLPKGPKRTNPGRALGSDDNPGQGTM